MVKKVDENNNKKKSKRDSKIKLMLTSIKNFFNRPAPLIIFLILMIVFLVFYIYKYNTKSVIYVGEIVNDDVQVASVHYFTNGDMNYFYASPAAYIAEDEKIYGYQIGYYAVDDYKNYYELVSRSSTLEKAESLREIVDELSSWDFAEPASTKYYFDQDVVKYLDNLHLVIKASTEKDSTSADIVVDYEVDLTKITK